jgi:inorganic triphosphatase YgiF
MSTDSGSPAGVDWTEREARFVVENDEYLGIRDTLDSEKKIGSHALGRSKVKQNDDTYFDTPIYGLHELGWSLRIRRSGHTTRITLKIPDSSRNDEAPEGSWHREIENTGYHDFAQVFEKIIELLQGQRLLHGGKRDRDAILGLAAWHGAHQALEFAGLQDLFTVSTVRHAWPVLQAGLEVAELSLDDSAYLFRQVRRDDSERQCRLEVELGASAPDELLSGIGEAVQRSFGIKKVQISKFEHGMILYLARKLDEKFEVKISIPRQSAHEEIVRAIKGSPEFVPGYLFTGDGTHRLHDVYFDTPGQHLFMAGCYLRLRRDGGRRDLKFRILSFNPDLGQAAQYEIAAKDTETDFPARWDQIQDRLSSTSVKGAERRPESLERIERTLSKMGLHPVLEVDVDRIGWSVLKGGSRGELIARLKYDKISFRKPGDKHGESQVEFEVAGAEDHDAAPRALRVSEYYNFLRAFTDQCRDSVPMNKIGWEINAKYFTGLIKLGLEKRIPDWYGTLRTQAASEPMRREPPADSPRFYAPDDSRQLALPGQDGTGTGESARAGETAASAGSSGNADRNVTVNTHISMSQAQSAQMNVSFGPYGQAILGELDKAYAYAQSAAPEAAPVIDAAREAVLAGDTRGLMSKLRSLGAKFSDIAQQVMLPVLTLFIEDQLGLHS